MAEEVKLMSLVVVRLLMLVVVVVVLRLSCRSCSSVQWIIVLV